MTMKANHQLLLANINNVVTVKYTNSLKRAKDNNQELQSYFNIPIFTVNKSENSITCENESLVLRQKLMLGILHSIKDCLTRYFI